MRQSNAPSEVLDPSADNRDFDFRKAEHHKLKSKHGHKQPKVIQSNLSSDDEQLNHLLQDI